MAVTYLYQIKYWIKCSLRPVFGLFLFDLQINEGLSGWIGVLYLNYEDSRLIKYLLGIDLSWSHEPFGHHKCLKLIHAVY